MKFIEFGYVFDNCLTRPDVIVRESDDFVNPFPVLIYILFISREIDSLYTLPFKAFVILLIMFIIILLFFS